jgi:hypothetical protein
MREAHRMSVLDHAHILGLVGVVRHEVPQLVLEFMPFGQMREFLECFRPVLQQTTFDCFRLVSFAHTIYFFKG